MRVAGIEAIYHLAEADERVIFIGSDVGSDTLVDFKRKFPNRFFIEGISEQHIIGMAAGLALDGFIPFVNTISTFLTRRCYEQILIDVCLQNLPVRLVGYGGGLTYAPLGPTHQAIEDIALMRAAPNMTVVCPCDAWEVKQLYPDLLNLPGPAYIRLSGGGEHQWSRSDSSRRIGYAVADGGPEFIVIVSTGIMTQVAAEVRNKVVLQGYECSLLHIHTVKPLDTATLVSMCCRAKLVVTIEEHVVSGGLGTAVLEVIHDTYGGSVQVCRFGLQDKFQNQYGTHEELLVRNGLYPLPIAESIIRSLST